MKKDKVKQSALLPTIEFSGFPSVRFLCSLVVSSFFPLFWSVLLWSAPALPSSLFLLSFHPSSFPGGVDGHGSVPVSFPSASLAGGWGCGTVLSCPRPFWCPSLPPLPFLFIRSPGWFCSVLCPSFRLSFFPFLSFSLSFPFFSYLFLSSRGRGWSLFCYCCVVVFHSFLFPLSFLLSSFPGGGGNVLFCPSLSVFPSFPFLSLVVLSSFLPSFCGGMVGYVSGVCCSPLSLLPFRPSFLSPSRVVGLD